MRILLVHPDDTPERGPWARETWDLAVDLGKGGAGTYQRWTEFLHCPAQPLRTLKLEDFPDVRSVLISGLGRVMDRTGLDWWELIFLQFHQQLEILMALERFASSLGGADQVFLTRSGLHANGLRLFLGDRIHCFPARFSSKSRFAHYMRLAWRFKPSQILQIFWDKYDTDYRVRSQFAARQPPCSEPVVLLPTAYENVSAIAMAYATSLPEGKFLLVATRQSGWVSLPPPNVRVRHLASYAAGNGQDPGEYVELIDQWRQFRQDLDALPEIALLARAGLLEFAPRFFKVGLGIRDAWRRVLDEESVRAVLCGDDGNPYTRLPLLLGKARGIPSVSCHHGAFEGRHMIKRNHADLILAKGRMEKDYLVRVCGLPDSVVEIGAPRQPACGFGSAPDTARRETSSILFFSEFYEVSSGRCEEFYRDVLPPLAELAVESGRRLIIKLHPFELRRQRQRLVARILTPEQRRITDVVSGRLTRDMLLRAWFGITVLSSAALECACLGIPCFLCRWLEFWPYGYIQQYGRFGAAGILESPAQIRQIPRFIELQAFPLGAVREWWQPASEQRLRSLFLRPQAGEHAAESNVGADG